MQVATLLTVTGESQLAADHRGVAVVPGVITHGAPGSTHAHLHPPTSESVKVTIVVVYGWIVCLSIKEGFVFSNTKTQLPVCADGWREGIAC